MDAEQLLNEIKARADEQVRQAEEFEATVLKMRVTTTSPCGSVKLTLQSNGGFGGIELTRRACDLGPKKLSALIMATQLKAQQEMTHEVESAFAGLGDLADIGRGATEMMTGLIGELVPSYRDNEMADNVLPLWRGAEDEESTTPPRKANPTRRRTAPARPHDTDDEFTERPW